MAARLFALHRGPVVIADGVEFDDDTVVIHTRGDRRSTSIWPSLDDALAEQDAAAAIAVGWVFE